MLKKGLQPKANSGQQIFNLYWIVNGESEKLQVEELPDEPVVQITIGKDQPKDPRGHAGLKSENWRFSN